MLQTPSPGSLADRVRPGRSRRPRRRDCATGILHRVLGAARPGAPVVHDRTMGSPTEQPQVVCMEVRRDKSCDGLIARGEGSPSIWPRPARPRGASLSSETARPADPVGPVGPVGDDDSCPDGGPAEVARRGPRAEVDTVCPVHQGLPKARKNSAVSGGQMDAQLVNAPAGVGRFDHRSAPC